MNLITKVCDWLIPDSFINGVLSATFSKPSLLFHTIWFACWFLLKLDVSLLTNIVSLEAIYLGALIGIQQMHHHKIIKKHLNDSRP